MLELVEKQLENYNRFDNSVCLSDTKNEEKPVRIESEIKQQTMPNYHEVPDLVLPKKSESAGTRLWNELNMDALAVMACFAYLVSIGEICPKTGRLKGS